MADYTLRYSGEEIDAICDKVSGMNFTADAINGLVSRTGPLRVRWGRVPVQMRINSRDQAYYYSVFFEDIIPEEAEDSDDVCILVNCDFGGEPFDVASVSYIKSGRSVEAKVLIHLGGAWTGYANELGTYHAVVYCLVVCLDGGGWSVG